RHTRSKRDWSSDVCSSDLASFHVSSPVVSHIWSMTRTIDTEALFGAHTATWSAKFLFIAFTYWPHPNRPWPLAESVASSTVSMVLMNESATVALIFPSHVLTSIAAHSGVPGVDS